MEFRRVDALPPYAFAEVERLKLELRRDGQDVIDLGFGNPDVAPPEIAVEKLREAAALPRNHRYSSSRGLPRLREAICDLYRNRFGVELDPETEATLALGAKEGLVHLLWVLLGPGDVALVPSPSYPIHLFAPGFAGAAVARVHVGPDRDFLANLEEAWLASQPRPRVLICSFPHNPTTACADLPMMQGLVDFAREKELVLVHDFAYADLAFDGYRPPSVFEAEGARDVAVELYSLTKGFSRRRLADRVRARPRRRDRRARAAEVVPRLRRVPAAADRGDRRAARGVGPAGGGGGDLPGPPQRAVHRTRARRLGGAAAARDDVRLGARSPSRSPPRARTRSRSGSSARVSSR